MSESKAELMRQFRARRRAERLAARSERRCAVCDKPIPASARADRRTCSIQCRQKLSQRRLIGRLRLSPDERRDAFTAISRWLAGPEPWPRLVAVEGVTFSVGESYFGTFVWAEAYDGDEHLAVRISQGGAIYWFDRTIRLERAFLVMVRRLCLSPRDEAIDFQQLAALADARRD